MIPTPRDGIPPSEWLQSWRGFWDHLQKLPGTTTWETVAVGAAILGLSATLVLRLRPGYPILGATIVLFIPAVGEFLYIGTREWPSLNDHHPRYVLGSIESVNLLLALVAVLPLSRVAAHCGRWWCFGIVALALLGVIAERYGVPSADRPRREIDASMGRWTEPLLAANVDAIGGDYWTVYSTLFHANMVLRERNERRFIVPVSTRARVLLERWDWEARPLLRVAVPKNPREREGFLNGIVLCELAAPEKIGETELFEIYAVHPLKPHR